MKEERDTEGKERKQGDVGCEIQRTVTEERCMREMNNAYREIGFDSKPISESDRGQELHCRRAAALRTVMDEK